MKTHVLLALLLAAGLAGCAEREDAISARDGLGPALAAALAHGSDPVLIGIASFEPFQHMAQDDYEVWVHLDENPGDGRAPGWFYTFASGNRTIGIVYAAGLGVIAEGYEEGDDGWGVGLSGAPITDWILDSTDAARAVRASEGWPGATDDTSVFWSLAQDEDGPVWFVEWDNATAGVEAMVDARTGNVTQRVEHTAMVRLCQQQVDHDAGLVAPTVSRSASVMAQAGEPIALTYSWSAAVGDVEVLFVGPSGQIDGRALSGSGMSTSSGYTAVDEGRYELVAQSTAGAAQVTLSLTVC